MKPIAFNIFKNRLFKLKPLLSYYPEVDRITTAVVPHGHVTPKNAFFCSSHFSQSLFCSFVPDICLELYALKIHFIECKAKHRIFCVKVDARIPEFFSKPAPTNFQPQIMIRNISHAAASGNLVGGSVNDRKWPL